MTLAFQSLAPRERQTFNTVVTFVTDRLCDAGIVDWAVQLTRSQRAERVGVRFVLHKARENGLEEPWSSAWELIEESWSGRRDPTERLEAHQIKRRVIGGDRSGALIEAIDGLVAPRIEVAPLDTPGRMLASSPATTAALMRASLTSGQLIMPEDVGIESVDDVAFLTGLANALDASVRYGLDAARRVGWDGSGELWRLGSLHHVRFGTAREDADQHHKGIAPSVKLLHGTVERLARLQPEAAEIFARRWGLHATPIDVRLWAEAATDPALVSGGDVASVLLGLDDRRFWDVHQYLEVAIVRARRFADFPVDERTTIAVRLQGLPPREHWDAGADAERVEQARIYWAAREMRRIEACGGELPPEQSEWLESVVGQFEELAEVTETAGLLRGPRAAWISGSGSSGSHGDLPGDDRLRALEAALKKGEYEEASGLVLTHEPRDGDATSNGREAAAVLALIETLSDPALEKVARALCEWFRTWYRVLVELSWERSWQRLWPFAVATTNAYYKPADVGNLNVLVRGWDPEDPLDADVINTEAGYLIDVFLEACWRASAEGLAWGEKNALREVRDALTARNGQAGVIVRYRLVAGLDFFVRMDEAWARTELIGPLVAGGPESDALWRAAASRLLTEKALLLLGDQVPKQVANETQGWRARGSLLRSLVVDSLTSFVEGRPPAVAGARLQQLLRSVDERLRMLAAEVVAQFSTGKAEASGQSAGDVYDSGVAPFLAKVWPQDAKLLCPSVAEAFAELPANAGSSFSAAVDAVLGLVVPFDCYIIGVYGLGDDGPGLSMIDDRTKAERFLRLLDATVGTGEADTVPIDLSDALEHIRTIARGLARDGAYRRLAAAARRWGGSGRS